jgi:hypothetical protein
MLESDLKYAFLTTYEQTIFLRKVDIGRVWRLEYSPVIYHHERGSTSSGGTVSFCQSLYHVELLALANAAFDTSTGTRNQAWTHNAYDRVISFAVAAKYMIVMFPSIVEQRST